MDPSSGFRRFPWLALAAAIALLLALPSGCGDDTAQCVSSRCPAGNECIDDASGKGPACHQVCTASSECPFNSFCNDGQPKSWCVAVDLPGARSSPPDNGEPPACPRAVRRTTPIAMGPMVSVLRHLPDGRELVLHDLRLHRRHRLPRRLVVRTVNESPNIDEQRHVVRADTRRVPAAHVLRSVQARPRLPRRGRRHAAALRAGHPGRRLLHERVRDRRQLSSRRDLQELAEPLHAGARGELQERRRLPARGRRVVAHCDGSHCTPECAADSDCAGGATCQYRGVVHPPCRCVPRKRRILLPVPVRRGLHEWLLHQRGALLDGALLQREVDARSMRHDDPEPHGLPGAPGERRLVRQRVRDHAGQPVRGFRRVRRVGGSSAGPPGLLDREPLMWARGGRGYAVPAP